MEDLRYFELIERGYSYEIAVEIEKCHVEKLKIIEEISRAFEGVTLGEGIGLFQAQAIDDYATIEEQITARNRDEKFNWKNIDSETLLSSSLSFLDAKGIKFHIPAYIIAELQGKCKGNIIYHLTALGENSLAQFSELNREQKNSIAGFLRFTLKKCDEIDAPRVLLALAEYWAD